MKNGTRLLGIALLAAVVGGTLLPAKAEAQFRRRRNGDIVRADWTVRPLVDAAERQSNAFRQYFENNFAKGRIGRYHDNKFLKNHIQRMDEAIERLRSKADDRRPGIGKGELQQALAQARTVDREIYFAGDTRKTIREWTDLRATFNDLARLYRVRGV